MSYLIEHNAISDGMRYEATAIEYMALIFEDISIFVSDVLNDEPSKIVPELIKNKGLQHNKRH